MSMYMRVNNDERMLEMLMKQVERYNEMVAEENHLDWYSDVLGNMNDTSDTEEMREAHAKIESAILAIKVKERMSAKR